MAPFSVPAADASFLHALYPLLAEAAGDDANLIMSSFSASTVLAMLLPGIKGQTREQLEQGRDRDKKKRKSKKAEQDFLIGIFAPCM